ncbi:MAG TPA: hypothetical protein VEG84_08725, partial [Thermoanaerobaculia bacterium]|nr:hypothetical protein [Thermoanaerobaculia bacterium]
MRRFGAAFAVLLTAAGCRSAASTDVTRSAFEGLPPQAALRAFVYHDRLLLAFRENSRDVLFKAKWKGQILEKEGDYRFRMTRLELIEKLPPGVEKSRPSVREAQVVPLDRVPDIVARLADRLAPADPGQATFLALGAEELFVRRDTVGRAFVEARAEAPPNLRIARRLNPTQFAREIFAFIAEQRSGDAG